MNQSEALTLAVEMLERVAPGSNYDTREFYDRLREIRRRSRPASAAKMVDKASTENEALPKPTLASWPRTAILDGEEFCEIERRTIRGRDFDIDGELPRWRRSPWGNH